jgi:D-alanyl-D-alanine carboxypeptidase/D-alanyl-D-alanine-endopeptidase (penicillin-binding protein 4)
VRRLARAAWLSLALLSLFTIGAGVAVAHVLPGRLVLWRLPMVAPRPLAVASPVLGTAPGTATGASAAGAPATGLAATPAGLRAALSPELGSAALGPHVAAVVTDLSTGQLLFSQNGAAPFEPASTAKLATAVAALDVLGPAARLQTRVVAGRTPSAIVLVGGGDPTLAAGPPPAADYPQPATLSSLAAATAKALRARHIRRVRLSYDTALFTGPGLAPGWPASYISTGNVSPIQSLEVDQGRLTASGAPQDADDPQDFRPRSRTPAADAASAFAGFLGHDGIGVQAVIGQAVAGAASPVLARVMSPPVAEIVQWMLMESNNVIAENLARQVAIATGHPASFSGAAAAELAVLRKLGAAAGVSLVEGSGLSPGDQVSPDALVRLLRLAAAPGGSGLRAAITGLPVAGFTGTLAPGGSVFGQTGSAGLGLVRAKTGNLVTVAAIAGIAYARNGQLLAFAFMADHLPARALTAAGADMTGLTTALAGCGCH